MGQHVVERVFPFQGLDVVRACARGCLPIIGTIGVGAYFSLGGGNPELEEAELSLALLLKKSSWPFALDRVPVKISLSKAKIREIKQVPVNNRLVVDDFLALAGPAYHALNTPVVDIYELGQHGDNRIF